MESGTEEKGEHDTECVTCERTSRYSQDTQHGDEQVSVVAVHVLINSLGGSSLQAPHWAPKGLWCFSRAGQLSTTAALAPPPQMGQMGHTARILPRRGKDKGMWAGNEASFTLGFML